MKMTERKFRAVINERFKGVLTQGAHSPDSRACALEAYAVATGTGWTDRPAELGIPDLRPLNDGVWTSDAARTAALVRLVAALSDWTAWPVNRCRGWGKVIVLRTIREIVADLPGIPPHIATRCIRSKSLHAAEKAAALAATVMTKGAAKDAVEAAVEAAQAARARARTEVEVAAQTAAVAAQVAAEAAARAVAVRGAARAGAAGQAVLRRACRIWIEAVKASRRLHGGNT